MNKMNKKGFTLIEMLVVIAIIAVLVSIIVPVVGDSTEKAKEAADAANIRSHIAEITTAALTDETVTPVTYTMTQNGKFDKTGITDIGGEPITTFESKAEVKIEWDANKDEVKFTTTDATAGS